MTQTSRRWPSIGPTQYTSLAYLVLTIVYIANCLNGHLAEVSREGARAAAPEQQHQDGVSGSDLPNHDLSVAESGDSSAQSHVIIVNGWPTVSRMWPTTNRDTVASDDGSKMPFIFADKPKRTDYDLLLSMNGTVRDTLNSYSDDKIGALLEFEYYFDYDRERIENLPSIKIDVNRRQEQILSANNTAIKRWQSFRYEPPFTNGKIADDWLKISLVNREFPSLVAIRKIKLVFQYKSPRQEILQDSVVTPQTASETEQEVPPVTSPVEASPSTALPKHIIPPPPPPSPPSPPSTQSGSGPARSGQISQQHIQEGTRHKGAGPPRYQNMAINQDDTLYGEIAPVKRGVKLRKARDTSAESSPGVDLLALTCYNRHECNWLQASVPNELDWSLVRQPPSNEMVTSGYYYDSDQVDIGTPGTDSRPLLSIYLNETELATKANQMSDHCIDLALYVSGLDVTLRMVALTRRRTGESGWIRGNHLMTWTATTVEDNRVALPNSTMVSANNNGWSNETICFNEFFGTENCGSGQCALGFEMVPSLAAATTTTTTTSISPPTIDRLPGEESPLSSSTGKQAVVAVALVSSTVHNKAIKAPRASWLQSWQRDEIEPATSWSFRPKFDWQLSHNGANMRNLHDQASYVVTSDWLEYTPHINLTGALVIGTVIRDEQAWNRTMMDEFGDTIPSSIRGRTLFSMNVTTRLVSSDFAPIYDNVTLIEYHPTVNATDQIYRLGEAQNLSWPFLHGKDELRPPDDKLFKVVITIALYQHEAHAQLGDMVEFHLSLTNVSVSDRCYPSPCLAGACEQLATGPDDWRCNCQEKYWGRRCNFGKWCDHPHVTPNGSPVVDGTKKQQLVSNLQANGGKLITGNEYCLHKLGPGYNCTNMEVPLDDTSQDGEGKTFDCNCQSDYYLGDDSKCGRAHKCHSQLCPSMGMVCDTSKSFNATQPCHCDENQDWYPADPADLMKGCVRKQCHDKMSGCGFSANLCIANAVGESPICRCGEKFRLEIDAASGKKICKSIACSLPSLNDCHHLCRPNDMLNETTTKPFTCDCYPGFTLAKDQRTCQPTGLFPCDNQCQENQICTASGCQCKPGYLADIGTPGTGASNGLRCLNVCSIGYAENRTQFDRIQQVCPLGECQPDTFNCACSDKLHLSSVSSRYEPRMPEGPGEADHEARSPLCQLKRVCDRGSDSYNQCHSLGALCVPDYGNPRMFDCVCPPGTEKSFQSTKLAGRGPIGELFTCEPKCLAKRNECLRQQGVCKLVDKDRVVCDCLPGFIYNQQLKKCYLAKYSYRFQLVVVNKYYQPESSLYRRIIPVPSSDANNGTAPILARDDQLRHSHGGGQPDALHVHPQFRTMALGGDETPAHLDRLAANGVHHEARSVFEMQFNQCNLTALIPKAFLDDIYQGDLGPFATTIEECNVRLNHLSRAYRLNTDLVEDIRQSLRQTLSAPFTLAITNSSCSETDSTGLYLNCTIYLQSDTPVERHQVEELFTKCDPNGIDNTFCWIKPKVLLQKSVKDQLISAVADPSNAANSSIGFAQIVPCELDSLCGPESQVHRLDNSTSLCSCKCLTNADLIVDTDLLPRHENLTDMPVKETCTPINHCQSNATYCLQKPGSDCHYDRGLGAQCRCRSLSQENEDGHCVEVALCELDNTLIILAILLGTALVVSLTINLVAAAKSGKFIGKNKEYPLSEFSAGHHMGPASSGIPNSAFLRD